MKFNADAWKVEYRNVVKGKKAENTPTVGVLNICATIRTIRAGLIDDIVGGKPQEKWTDDDKMQVQAIRDSLGELLEQVQASDFEHLGFACNSSAAAKAAGYKTSAKTLELVD